MKIKVLSKQLANMIAAGEVVEKPASVVKELVENSIDAGADTIKIEIVDGGISRIEITDNGSGMEKEDVSTAFLPHATSKITTQTDLEAIATLGFRGEALASISAVSEVEITTKTKDSLTGTKLTISGGEVQTKTECASSTGTKIIVKNLFFNTPARKKFLNKPKLEENDITRVVEKFMLSYPNIKFQYFANSKEIYNTAGTGLLDNIFLIYGKEVADNLMEVDYTDGTYTLSGYISKTSLTKPNRTYQISFINGRMVKDFYMENAIQCAYQDYLMHSNFPVCFLNLKVPYNTVDVNIHPSKQEVKYENPREINLFFIKALAETLEKSHTKKFNEIFFEQPKAKVTQTPQNNLTTSFQKDMTNLSKTFGISFKKEENLNLSSGYSPLKDVYLNTVDTETLVQKEDNKTFFDRYEKLAEKKYENVQIELPEINLMPKYKIIGVAFSTYIILELENKLLLIDQHACHERKIYDKLKSSFQDKNSAYQQLLTPYVFTLNTAETQAFLDHLQDFQEIGITLQQFGENTFCITEVPFLLKELNCAAFVEDLKANIHNLNVSQKGLLKDFLARTACKSAVKAGDSLATSEIEALINDLNNHKVLLCPHGRPFVYEIQKRDIEKWFKRIV